ncbi:cell division protein ZapB [Gallaecimonas pentaromativorans]|uniref:Cell division protein ZapB n=1 Tax=Gallaecimonas pentaromativorans TaxID=584787 RepID=A0A3N1PAQ7_9GAMM|nr:cell division protein ZapB [Gallaecimonas pentaromativorans]MED5525206.1 cell division protein ZapB [Pseudomonadota bacterium]ROQ24167.1 cell division protein ZapB [Gallaecimonas pentaromativorans]
MSLELLEKLEAKVQAAVDTIGLLQMEIEELRAEKGQMTGQNETLAAENQRLKGELETVQTRINAVLGKIAQVDDLL